MSKVLLIHPFSKWDILREPPYSLMYLASYLRKGNSEVEIMDRNMYTSGKPDPDSVLISRITANAYDYVGITAMTAQLQDAFYISRLVKKYSPMTKIIIGGTHATALPEVTLAQCDTIDYVCRGEGEKVLYELVTKNDHAMVDGLTYRTKGRIVSNKDQDLLDINTLPMPARDLVDIDLYSKLGWPFRLGSIQIYCSRGCPRRCAFCARFAKFSKARYRSLESIFDEIDRVAEEYAGIRTINFNDDLFMPDNDRLMEFCDIFIKKRLNKRFFWRACLTTDRVDKKVLSRMKKANCITIIYGFESFSQRILDYVNKGTTVEQNYRAAAVTKRCGIPYIASMMANVPGETKEDVIANLDFIRKERPDIVNFSYFRPYVGSPLFEKLLSAGRITYEWDKYTFGCRWDKKDPWYFSGADRKWLFKMESDINREFNYGGLKRTFYKLLFTNPGIARMVLADKIRGFIRELRKNPLRAGHFLWASARKVIADMAVMRRSSVNRKIIDQE